MARKAKQSAAEEGDGPAPVRGLSARERQILGLAAAGLVDKQIAGHLGISGNTLRTYWGRIRGKLGRLPRAALTAMFVSGSLYQSPDAPVPDSLKLLGGETTDTASLQRVAIYYAIGFEKLQGILAKVARAANVLAAYARIGSSVVPEELLLGEVCRLFVEVGGYVMSWAGAPESDGKQSVRILAAFGENIEYLQNVEVSWGDGALGRGPGGTALRTGETQYCRDILADPAMTPWREQAVRFGFQSSIALPLRNDAGVFGMLSVYACEPDGFGEQEARLFEVIGQDLSARITILRALASPAV